MVEAPGASGALRAGSLAWKRWRSGCRSSFSAWGWSCSSGGVVNGRRRPRRPWRRSRPRRLAGLLVLTAVLSTCFSISAAWATHCDGVTVDAGSEECPTTTTTSSTSTTVASTSSSTVDPCPADSLSAECRTWREVSRMRAEAGLGWFILLVLVGCLTALAASAR